MPTTQGTVTRIAVSDGYCCVTIQPSVGGAVTVLPWFFSATQVDDSDRRFSNSYYLSLAREAMAFGKKLEAVTPTGSSIVTSMALIP